MNVSIDNFNHLVCRKPIVSFNVRVTHVFVEQNITILLPQIIDKQMIVDDSLKL